MRLYYFYFMPRAIYILKINKKKAAEAAYKITKVSYCYLFSCDSSAALILSELTIALIAVQCPMLLLFEY